MILKTGKITKLSDDKFEGKHPNLIDTGYVKEGHFTDDPQVDQSFSIGSLTTSTVTEIVSQTDKVCVFKTLNSTYMLEYLGTITVKPY